MFLASPHRLASPSAPTPQRRELSLIVDRAGSVDGLQALMRTDAHFLSLLRELDPDKAAELDDIQRRLDNLAWFQELQASFASPVRPRWRRAGRAKPGGGRLWIGGVLRGKKRSPLFVALLGGWLSGGSNANRPRPAQTSLVATPSGEGEGRGRDGGAEGKQ